MGLTIEGKYHLQLLHKPARDKRLAELLLCMRTSVGLIACEVGDFLNIYISILEEPLEFIAHCTFFGDCFCRSQ